MRKLKPILLLSLLAFLISSCELLGIGGKNKDDTQSGEVVGRIENQQENIVRIQPAVDKNRTYFLQDGRVKSAALEEARIVWSNKLVNQGSGAFSRKMIQTTDRIFVEIGSEIRAYDKANGDLMWKNIVSETSAEISGLGGPIMSQDTDYLYAGRRGYVLKVRKEDGQVVRRYPLDRLVPEGVTQGSTEPIISPGGDVLYVPTSYYDRTTPGEEEFGGTLFAFNAITGEVLARYSFAESEVILDLFPMPCGLGTSFEPIVSFQEEYSINGDKEILIGDITYEASSVSKDELVLNFENQSGSQTKTLISRC